MIKDFLLQITQKKHSNLLLYYIYTVLLFLLRTYCIDWYMNFTGYEKRLSVV